jgi:hypothetical protein
MPMESAYAISSLIFGGVMEKLPNLRFLFAHGNTQILTNASRWWFLSLHLQ